MMEQVLSPSMEDGNETNLCPQVSRIGGDGAQGFAGGAEQNAIHHLLVLIGHVGDRLRQGKNHMEILHREQLRLTVFEPLCARQRLAFGTMAGLGGGYKKPAPSPRGAHGRWST